MPLYVWDGSKYVRIDDGSGNLNAKNKVYDADLDGLIEQLASHTHSRGDISDFFSSPFWDNIPDKPSQFPPEPHTHSLSDINAGSGYYPAKTSRSDNLPSWNDIPDKPSEFPPEAHTHSRSDISDFFSSPFWDNIPDKPSQFPPEPHASNHLPGGSDQLFDQSLNTTDDVKFNTIWLAGNEIKDSSGTTRITLGDPIIFNGFIRSGSGSVWIQLEGENRVIKYSVGKLSINAYSSAANATYKIAMFDYRDNNNTGALNSGTSVSVYKLYYVSLSSASRLDYKENIQEFGFDALDTIRRLRFYKFTWKLDGRQDFGLIADYVADIDPNLVSRDSSDKIVGLDMNKLVLYSLRGIQQLYDVLVTIKNRVDALESRLRKLEAKLNAS